MQEELSKLSATGTQITLLAIVTGIEGMAWRSQKPCGTRKRQKRFSENQPRQLTHHATFFDSPSMTKTGMLALSDGMGQSDENQSRLCVLSHCSTITEKVFFALESWQQGKGDRG